VLRAPAGFGKSIALEQSLEGDTVSYALTQDVDGPWAFLRGLANALDSATPSVRLSLSAAWDRAAEAKAPAEHLARWLHSHLADRKLTIALDQLHYVSGSDLVERLLARLVELSSPGIRWVFSMRTEFDLPVPRWMAECRMDVPIDADALRFTEEEIALAAQLWGRKYTMREAAGVFERTEGWPTGVAFAVGMGLNGERRLVEAGADLFGALAERILSERTEREREFLFTTCMLPQLDDELCRAAGFGDAAEILSALSSCGDLIFAQSRGVRQYHDRFAQHVQELLRARGTVGFHAVLTITVSALEELGRIEQALRIATKYDLRSEITRILDRYGLEMVQNGDDFSVRAALGALGAPSVAWSAQTLALSAIFESRAGRFDTSDAWFSTAMDRTHGAMRAEIAYRCGSEMLQRRRAAVELLAPHAYDTQLPLPLRIGIVSALASAYMQAGDAARANGCIRDALHLARIDDPRVLVPLDVRAAYVLLYSGHRERAKEVALRGAQLAEESSQFQMACAAYSTLYAAAADEDDPRACLEYLASFAENAAKSGNHRMQFYSLVGRLELEAERGNATAVEELTKALQFFDVQYEELDTTEGLLPPRSLQLAWERRFEEAYRLLLPSAPQQIERDRSALRWSEVAVYSAACGERNVARSALHAVRLALSDEGSSTVRAHRAKILAACALGLLGRHGTALNLLGVSASNAPSRRIRALCDAVSECVRSMRGDRNGSALDSAMTDLAACDGGGIARALLALPRPAGRHTRVVDAAAYLQNDPDEFAAELLGMATLPHEQTLEIHAAVQLIAERIAEYLCDRDVRALQSWMESFAERHDYTETLRTVISLVPRALEAFLARRGYGDAKRVSDLPALDEVLRKVALRSHRRSDATNMELIDEVDAAINGLITKLDSADPLTAEHSRAVASWCARLARLLGFEPGEVVHAARSGLIHDIGKIYTPREILNAPRALTSEEWRVMRAHAAAGEGIVRRIPELRYLSVAVRNHHERLDGRGYPDGMRGSEIPRVARLVAVADSFNAMIGRRPYRRPIPPSVALAELERHRGTQFDPEIADALIAIVSGGGSLQAGA